MTRREQKNKLEPVYDDLRDKILTNLGKGSKLIMRFKENYYYHEPIWEIEDFFHAQRVAMKEFPENWHFVGRFDLQGRPLNDQSVNRHRELKKKHPSKTKEPGQEEESFRKKFPATIRTHDGHMVRSRGEAMIDNWLYSKRISHAYERKVPIPEELYCDFYINEGAGCYLEYWGREDGKYLDRRQRKIELYRKHKKNFIEIGNKDINKLDDVMPSKLRSVLPKSFEIE